MGLIIIANQQFKLPDHLSVKEFDGHPRTVALVDDRKKDNANPLGVVDSFDVRAAGQDVVAATKALLERNGVCLKL
jgi:hypothetical protein